MGLSDTHHYLNFELIDIAQFGEKLDEYPSLAGCNVTIPYKRAIVQLLDSVDPVAERIGAVNTVSIQGGKTKGYNTDYIGFRDDLLEQMEKQGRTLSPTAGALILGTGGASLGVAEALQSLGVMFTHVSRKPSAGELSYQDLSPDLLDRYRLIVNTTPLGMYPRIDAAPGLNYSALTPQHFCYDLTYNPAETRFMQLARQAGAGAANGLGMLHKQAEAAWAIWNAE